MWRPPCYAPARMATTAEARPFRAARRPGALELVTSGFREIWTHRRLTRYLVRADLKKHGSDTVLGNVWWVLDPLLQMAVYVVLVSVIFQIGKPTTIRCSSSPRSCRGSGSRRP